MGFEPVGQVMGSAVHHVGRSGRYRGCHDCLYGGIRNVFSGAEAVRPLREDHVIERPTMVLSLDG
ncbi:hypothetical protein ACH47Z_21895 [Streptomyces sp. NPDC020192]|uniref:hypothetical protein n=1 Tax=Streptomyces sp. NPDC020192 TaxID=3365066 RepID=UPI00379B2D61